MKLSFRLMLSALVGVPMVAHCATPEQAAVERLKSAFECAYITDVHYEIPQTDDAAHRRRSKIVL